MVEKQEPNIDDTGVLSKEDSKIEFKSCSKEREVTDYWEISGAMDSTPRGKSDSCGDMKLQGAADETTANHADANENHAQNDNVTLTTADNSNAMKQTYCENGRSAISEAGMKVGGDDGHKNSNNSNNSSVPYIGSSESKGGHMSKHSDPFSNCDEDKKDTSNASILQRESNTVGTEQNNTKGEGSDANDTVSNNMMTSGAKDNCPDGDNKTVLSLRDQMLSNSECTEERFRIDRKKLEQMLQAASEGRGQSGEDFFQKIMDDTSTHITWPSKLKIGAKSKKDPHVRICGKPNDIKQARHRVMLSLDTKSNRVTIKMDVSHTEHSHVIGKSGNNIKRVMQETDCHIHFPDSNRNSAGEKSNQVSITGHPEGVESARTKIRSLLPIVLQFEIPNTGLPIPDLNSPIIQHLVQVYGISIQFKQRAKAYATSCTVRGSADNTDGLKTGIQMLMNQVAGTQLAVQTQIEIAPQHHSYMLTKPGLNVTTITQTTGARIIFPDPNALPKKSTVYVSGQIDSVILARRKLMGCLPLLLMFDMKEESDSQNSDAVKISSLMETLDISINLKSKPRQPSRTVIIKGIECNIYNMFEARGKLLGLESSGVTRPAQSQSPKLGRNAAITPTPVILLAHSHVPTPTVQTAVIGLTEQKPVTPIPILGNPNYVLTHGVPSNPATPRPISATIPAAGTPSQSPFPNLPNINIPRLASDQHLTTNQVDLIQRKEDPVNARYTLVSSNMSPPTTVQVTRSASLPTDQLHYQVNASTPGQLCLNGEVSNSALGADNRCVYQQNYCVKMQTGISQQQEFETIPRQNMYHNFCSGNVPKVESKYDDRMLGNYRQTPIASLDQLLPKDEERIAQQNRDIEKRMNEHLMRQAGVHYRKNAGMLTDEDLLRQQLGMTERSDIIQSPDASVHALNSTNSIPAPNIRQCLVQNIRSPDSIGESRASIPSERNSPLSSTSDRYNGNSNSHLGYDQFDEQSVHRGSSPPSSACTFHSHQNGDVNSLSPPSSVSHHRSPPQIVLNQKSHGGFEGNNLAENPTDLGDIYQQTQQGIEDISTGPPPGFEGFAPTGAPALKAKDYDNFRKLAEKAMESKPVSSEVRRPTDVWAGWGFSKSMPFGMKEELKKLAASKGRFSHLPTTFENGEVLERKQPSPVEEEAEYGMERPSPNRLRVPRDNPVERGGSNLNAWRKRRLANMDLSLGGNMGLNYMSSVQRPTPQKHSAFTPIHPNESINRSSTSPKSNPVGASDNLTQAIPIRNSPFSNSGNEGSLHVPLPDKPKNQDSRINMSSTPTIQDSLGLTANSASSTTKVEPDIPDVLNRLGLPKYIPVFHQQEVDYQTFLTLTDQDLKELGITTFGPRKKILLAIKNLSKDRDIFSGPKSSDTIVHENLSDHMLQLQRLELQQHRDNPQTTAPSRLDSHSLLSTSRQLFNTQPQHVQDHPDGPAMDSGFYEGSNRRNADRMRPSRLWQNSRTGGSNSGRW